MVTIYDRLGRRVSSSRNLRGIIAHAGKVGVNVIRIRPETSLAGTYAAVFYFFGGDEATTEWADWRVLLDWLPRRRSACPDRLTLPEAFYLEAYEQGRLKPIQARGTVVTVA
jgi:hypothetical protein